MTLHNTSYQQAFRPLYLRVIHALIASTTAETSTSLNRLLITRTSIRLNTLDKSSITPFLY